MENVLLEKQGHVSIITINREKALNALSTAVLNDLEEAVNTVEADKDTYCVVIWCWKQIIRCWCGYC